MTGIAATTPLEPSGIAVSGFLLTKMATRTEIAEMRVTS